MRWLLIGSIATMLLLSGLSGAPTVARGTPTPAAPAASGPLDARLGGTHASFEAKFGRPLPDATNTPNVAVYRPKNVGQITVTFGDDRAIAIMAVADRLDHQPLTEPDDKDWSVTTATRRAKTFLPADAAFAKPLKGAGSITSACNSPALAAALAPDTLARLGAPGQPGDCKYVLHLDTDGRVSSIEITLGHRATAATVAATTSRAGTVKHCADFHSQAEAQAYFDAHGGADSPEVRGLDADRDGKACEALK